MSPGEITGRSRQYAPLLLTPWRRHSRWLVGSHGRFLRIVMRLQANSTHRLSGLYD